MFYPRLSVVMRRVPIVLCAVFLSGCAEIALPDWADLGLNKTGTSDGPIPVSGANTVEELDTATDAERARATSTAAAGGAIGSTIATLGSAAEPGFWLKTPLVDVEQNGVVRSSDTGRTVAVTLIPIDGPETAGSRISLSAMRSLDLPLTALAELSVSAAR